MRRRRVKKRKTRFKTSKKSLSNNKSIYITIALVCMIGLNIGAIGINIARNLKTIMSFQTEILSEDVEEDKFRNIKSILKKIFKKDDKKLTGKDIENEFEGMEDFIIIRDLEEYENFIVVKDSRGKFNLADIPEPVNVKKIKIDKNKPYILAFHTHSNEGYQPLKRNINYTSDNNQNVVVIGELFSKVLESSGHKIVHNKTHHDIPSFNKSYSRSLNTIKTEVAKEKNINFIFDIHRDGMLIKSKTEKEYFEKVKEIRKRFSTTIDGKEVATFSLVVGPDSANYNQVLSYAKYIKAVSDTIYPGLCTGIIIKKVGRFNQYLSDYSALLEVGAQVNTIDQSKETIKLIGEILDIVISKLIL